MRLIDAKLLEKQIKEAFADSNPVLMGQMLRWVRKQPTIETDPVWCKDCKHFVGSVIDEPICKLREGLVYVTEETFCYYGERRSDGA